MKKLVSVSQMVEIAESLDWNVSISDNDYEFSKYSPAGEDFSFSVEGNSVDKIVSEIRNCANDFDVEEHIEMWVSAKQNGTSGIPSIKDLVEDADAIKEMLEELTCALGR